MKKRRSAVSIMMQLVGLVKPLLHIMLLAILLGTTGYLCAIFLTILASMILMNGLGLLSLSILPSTLMKLMILIAICRGILHYAEQYCNHDIAFRLLALIRHLVFEKLRKLCPAKLEGKDRGNLISLITSDIELLEVFYAHTISPIAIAIVTSLCMILFIGHFHMYAGLLAMSAYLCVGLFLPLWNGKRGGEIGLQYRNQFGECNSFVLDSLYGLDEMIQFHYGTKRTEEMKKQSRQLSSLQERLSNMEGSSAALTNSCILFFSFAMLILTIALYYNHQIDFSSIVICTVAMMGSFGPVSALASLSNNLNQTLASGERVLTLLEENPLVEEVDGIGKIVEEAEANVEHVSFQYDQELVLDDVSLKFEKGKITGIHGQSGSGKSTILKLLMRFWDTDQGKITINQTNVKKIPTKQLRNTESYVEQETCIFHDTIANNISLAKQDATKEEIMQAAQKASLHEFITKLPDGYDTIIGGSGDKLSAGEKQRIGLARAFLHDAPLLLLDEPTSNLDSLNEGIILKALKEEAKDKTIVLVSHRDSTMRIAESVIEMESKRAS